MKIKLVEVDVAFLKAKEEELEKNLLEEIKPYIEKARSLGYEVDYGIYRPEEIDLNRFSKIKEYCSYIYISIIKNGLEVEHDEGTLGDTITIVYTQNKYLIFEEYEHVKQELIETMQLFIEGLEEIISKS